MDSVFLFRAMHPGPPSLSRLCDRQVPFATPLHKNDRERWGSRESGSGLRSDHGRCFCSAFVSGIPLAPTDCPKPNHGRQWGRWSRAGRTGCAARPPWASAAHPRSPVLPRRWPLSKTDYKERGRFKRNSSERVCPANVCPPPMHGPPCVRFVHKGAAVGARLGNWEGQRLNPSEATSCPPAQL